MSENGDRINVDLGGMGREAAESLAAVVEQAQSEITQYDDLQKLVMNAYLSKRQANRVHLLMDLWKITGSRFIGEMIRNICIKSISIKGKGRKDNMELGTSGFKINLLKSGSSKR